MIVECALGLFSSFLFSSAATIVNQVTLLKGLTPTKTIPPIAAEVESGTFRYELEQPIDAALASVRKDAAVGGWKESAPMGYPVFVTQTADTISNVDVESGRLSADGLTLTPDPGATVLTVSEVKTPDSL